VKQNVGYGSFALRQVIYTIIIFSSLVIAFTILGVLFSTPDAQSGRARPADTILPHLTELAGFGFLLGAGLAVVYGRKGLPLVFLTPALTLLLDLDHLPVYLGTAQPIRPAHSFLFLVVAVATMAITIKRLDLDLVVLSATLAHMGIDTGLFAPLSPINFDYVQLDPYRIPLLAGAVLAIAAAAFVLKREKPGVGSVSREMAIGA
jgi:hypothetical protein